MIQRIAHTEIIPNTSLEHFKREYYFYEMQFNRREQWKNGVECKQIGRDVAVTWYELGYVPFSIDLRYHVSNKE